MFVTIILSMISDVENGAVDYFSECHCLNSVKNVVVTASPIRRRLGFETWTSAKIMF